MFFIAVNPHKLKEIINFKKESIDNLLPKLFEVAKQSKVQTEVYVNKGKEGLKNILEDVLKTKPKYLYSLTSAGKGSKTLPFYIPHFHEKRIKEKISLQIIFGKNKEAFDRAKELEDFKLTDIRFVDSKYVAPISIWLYGNKLAFLIWESEIGILIENKETTETFKNYFNLLWKLAKK